MEKNVFVAVIASILILVAWPHLMPKQKESTVVQNTTQNTNIKQKVTQKKTQINQEKTFTNQENVVNNINIDLNKVPKYKLKTKIFELNISALGAKIRQINFLKHKTIFFTKNTRLDSPFFGFESFSNSLFTVSKKTDKKLILVSPNGDKIEYSILGDRKLGVKVSSAKSLKVEFVYRSNKEKGRFGLAKNPINRSRSFMYYYNNDLEIVTTGDMEERKQYNISPKWIALSDRYFTMAIMPQKGSFTSVTTENHNDKYILSATMEPLNDIEYMVYIGEKDVTYLRQFDKTLDQTVDYGIFSILAVPILEFMKFIHKYIPNYGWAIIILTILIRLLLYPLQHKSMKSMKKFQELQPHIAKIKEKHKDDKVAMNKEMMQFMSTHNVNMAKGCLPLILQMPVFFALYRVLGNAVELYKSPWGLWIVDLSSKDPLYLLPILVGVAMFIQQKMSPTSADPAQAKMMMIMPVAMAAIMSTLPSGLTLYILFSTVFGLVQQIIVNKQTN